MLKRFKQNHKRIFLLVFCTINWLSLLLNPTSVYNLVGFIVLLFVCLLERENEEIANIIREWILKGEIK